MGNKDHRSEWMMSEELSPHLASGNGTGGTRPDDRLSVNDTDRAHNLKCAIFYSAVAMLLILANQLAKHPGPGANRPDAAIAVRLDLSISPKSKVPSIENEPMGGGTYAIRFRLTNQGNWPVFYPLDPSTNRPVGHIVYRAVPGSAWILEKPVATPNQTGAGSHIAWVEMPPGGWVDGIYEDSSLPAGDHAYELELKASTDDKAAALFSQSYRLNANVSVKASEPPSQAH
jgi:hypothetical protein